MSDLNAEKKVIKMALNPTPIANEISDVCANDASFIEKSNFISKWKSVNYNMKKKVKP